MKALRIIISIPLIIMLNRCIGTDVLEEVANSQRIVITEHVDSLAVNESFRFAATLIEPDGTEQMANAQWSSSNASIIQIDNSGNATAAMAGSVTITARYLQFQDSVIVHAGDVTSVVSSRNGQFSGSNNYSVKGSFSLEQSGGALLLSFDNEFSTSNGPGLYVYLSNSPSNVSGGLEVGPLQSSQGPQEYRITDAITISTYDYVIIYCKPFGLPFGAGALNEI